MISKPKAAIVALEPVRSGILAMLAAEPASASQLARALDLPRQKVNYHLRALEAHGLVELVEERPVRGVTERIMRASAASYFVSPDALGEAGADPGRTSALDRLSARYLLVVASRAIREVGDLLQRARTTGRTLPTLTIDTEIRFRSATDRAAFTDDLTSAVAGLAARYHDQSTPGGRWHRLVMLAHPRPPEEPFHE